MLWKTCVNKTVQFHMFSHMVFTSFSQGVKPLRPCEQGIFHRVRIYAKHCEKPCEFLTCEKAVKDRVRKNSELSQYFSRCGKSGNLWTGLFWWSEPVEKTLKWEEFTGQLHIARTPPSPKEKYNVEVWFLSPSQMEPDCLHLSCIS